MVTCISHSPAETESLGGSWAPAATVGLVIGLIGDLGAGKTQLVRGLARGLDYTGRVHSPTFALINMYAGGRIPLFHIDLFRLNSPAEITGAGLGEYLDRPPGIVAVEWFEKWLSQWADAWLAQIKTGHKSAWPSDILPILCPVRLVWLEVAGENERRIVYEDFSP
jgi:tRNA threonylcarbamoyladenosine biosynthesis protein TsaE